MRRAPTHHLLIALLVTLICLATGYITHRFNLQMDVTANARHSLSDQTKATLQALQQPVEILAVLGPHRKTRKAVSELVGRYQNVKPNLSLEFINPETDPERARELNAAPNGELIVRDSSREQRLQALSERSLTGALRQIARSGERNIAFVIDHAERSISGTKPSDFSIAMQRIATSGYVSRELSLVTEPIINESTDLVVLADPRRPYFPGEIAAMLEYINRGGNLLWLTDTEINSQTGAGLSALALELGVDTLKGVVIDANSQSADLGSPTFVLLNQRPRHPINENLNLSVMLPQAKGLAITPLAGQNTLPLLTTSESSWTETGELEGAITFDENSDETLGPLTLGATIERQRGDRIQRIAVVGDADFASNQFVGTGSNLALLESLVVWLSGDADQLDFVTQAAPDSTLELTPKNIVVLSVVWLVMVPLAFFTIAGFVAYRRRR